MVVRRQHIISRGFQRFFGDGDQVLLTDKSSRSYKRVGTKDTFVAAHFNSWRTEAGWDTSLELEWQRIESLILPVLHSLLDEQGGDRQREAAKVLAALHFARSYSLREMQAVVAETTLISESNRYADDPKFIEMYADQFGHEPTRSELEAFVRERWADLTESGFLLQERMVHAYNWAKDYFAPLQVQFLYPRSSIEFVLGDTPLIIGDKALIKVGIRDRLALGDAQNIWMPLTRKCSMNFWGVNQELPPDALLPPSEVQKLNWLSWRAADRFLICHPNCDPSRLLATDLQPC